MAPLHIGKSQMLKRTALVLAGSLAVSVAHSAQVPLADFARHTQYESVKISPDGKNLAAISLIDGIRHLTLFNLETMKGNNIRARDGDEIVDYTWVSPNRVIYTMGVKLSGVDRPVASGELFAVNADGGSQAVLFTFRSGEQQTGTRIKKVTSERAYARLIDDLRDDDKFVIVATDDWDSGTEGSFSKLWKMNVESGARTPLGTAPIKNAYIVTDNDGKVRFATSEHNTDSSLEVYYRADEKAKWELVLSQRASGERAYPIKFSRDNSMVYWDCAGKDHVGGLCTWNDKDRKLVPIWKNKSVERTGLITSFDGKDVVGVKAMPGRPSIDVLKKDDSAIRATIDLMKQFPGDNVDIVSATPDGRKVVILTWADVNPGVYYLLDRDTNKLTELLQRASWIKPDDMAMMEPFEIKARDGVTLHGYLSKPAGKEDAKHLPLVVMPHGGPHGVRDEWGYNPYVQALASRGYAVLQLNFRGSGGYGYNFMTSGYRQWGAKMQDDLTDATHWAISTGAADPKRICIYGISYGGYASLMGAVREPDLYRCAIGDAGVYELNYMYTRGDIQKSLYGQSAVRRFIGEDKAELAQRSPALQAHRIKANVMLIVGGQDVRVPPAHAETMRAALIKNGAKPEWLYQRTEGHGFYNEANRTDMLEKVIAFLDANIGAGAGK
jgi:dipeptidyl aminopeptidase/acylaminoacyl peptidase